MVTIRKAAAELIRVERKARKLKRREVARRLGAKPSWLRRKETGRSPVHLDEFLDLADAIGFNAVEAFRLLAQHHADLSPAERALHVARRNVLAKPKVFTAVARRTKRVPRAG